MLISTLCDEPDNHGTAIPGVDIEFCGEVSCGSLPGLVLIRVAHISHEKALVNQFPGLKRSRYLTPSVVAQVSRRLP